MKFNVLRRLLTWQDAASNPTSTASYAYDGEGERVWQQTVSSGTTTTTQYIGSYEEISTTGSTTTTTKYYAAGLTMATNVNGTLSYLVGDGLGSVSEALSSTGSVTSAQLFAPYGGTRYSSGTMPTSYGYTRQRGDPSGLTYMHARYYDGSIGAFISPDTVQGPNRYGYVAGNPTTMTDPTGYMKLCGGMQTDGGNCHHGHGGTTTSGCTGNCPSKQGNSTPPHPTVKKGNDVMYCSAIDRGSYAGCGGNPITSGILGIFFGQGDTAITVHGMEGLQLLIKELITFYSSGIDAFYKTSKGIYDSFGDWLGGAAGFTVGVIGAAVCSLISAGWLSAACFAIGVGISGAPVGKAFSDHFDNLLDQESILMKSKVSSLIDILQTDYDELQGDKNAGNYQFSIREMNVQYTSYEQQAVNDWNSAVGFMSNFTQDRVLYVSTMQGFVPMGDWSVDIWDPTG